MPLTKETVIDKVEIDEFGNLSVRRATYAVEDGVRIGMLGYHRAAYTPDDDIGQEDIKIKNLSHTAWTPAVIAQHNQRKAARQEEERNRNNE